MKTNMTVTIKKADCLKAKECLYTVKQMWHKSYNQFDSINERGGG